MTRRARIRNTELRRVLRNRRLEGVIAAAALLGLGNGQAYALYLPPVVINLVFALIFGFAVCTKPAPGPSAIAALSGVEQTSCGTCHGGAKVARRLSVLAGI